MTTDGPHRPLPPDPDASIIAFDGPIDRAEIEAFCRRVLERIERSDADPVVCDLGRVARPDAVTVEALARLQLEARRLGRRLVFRDACGELRDLVAFVGLDRALPCDS
jgi:anti-anti-sigma regulatory factor